MLDAGDIKAYGWFNSDSSLDGYVRAVPTDDQKTLQCLEAAGDPRQGLAGAYCEPEEHFGKNATTAGNTPAAIVLWVLAR